MMDSRHTAWPFFDDRHRAVAARLQDFLTRHPLDEGEPADAAAAAETVRSHAALLGREGILSYLVPGAHGGAFAELDARSICLCREFLGYANPLADFAFVMQGLGSAPVSRFGSDEMKAEILPRIASGEALIAFALTEESAGTDAAAMQSRAYKDGGTWLLNGTKTFISNAGIADYYVTFAVTDAERGTRGISAFLVRADDPGFRVSETLDVISPHPLGSLSFEDCRLPAGRLIGEEGQGFAIAMANLDIFRPSVGAAALGFARRAMDAALDFAANRRMFGQTLADFQLTQARIADMATALDAAALLIYRAVWQADVSGRAATREASMAKMFATEEAQKVIDSAVQLFGGRGVCRGNIAEKLYRDVRALRIYEGTTEINKLVIARHCLKDRQREGR